MVDFAKLFEKEAEEDAALKNYAARLPVYGVDPETGLTNYTNPVVPELKLPVQGIHDQPYIPTQYDIKGPIRFLPAVQEGAGNVRAIMNEGFESPENIAAKVFGPIGGNDVERVQTWPEKMVRSGASLPTDVMAGKVLSGPGLRATDYSDIPGAPQPLSNLIERTQDLAGLAAGGSVAATGLKAEKPGILSRGAKTLKDRLTQSLLEDSEAGTGISAIRNAAYKIGDNVFEAPIHAIAMDNAKAAMGIKRTQDLIDLHPGENLHDKLKAHNEANGFVTNTGKFVSRSEAQEIVNKNDQLLEGKKGNRLGGLNAEDIKLLNDNEAGTGISSLAQRMNEHLNEVNRGNETRSTGMNKTMPEILARQRASEGYEAAIRDPETKKFYTGMWHEEVLDKIAKDKGIPKDQLPTNLVKGYMNDRGQFLSEAALERRQQARANSKTAMFRSDDIVGTGLAAVQAPRFYSHMENVINDAKMMVRDKEGKRVEVPQEKFNSNELNAYLKNKGVSNEEIEALRIPEFLEGKKSVTKQELLNHLNENKVELQEHWKGGKPQKSFEEWSKENGYGDHEGSRNLYNDLMRGSRQDANNPTRFAQYQLAGGSNYRELLLSLKDNPSKVKRIGELNNEIFNIDQEMKGPKYANKSVAINEGWEGYNALRSRRTELSTELRDLTNAFTHDHWPGNKDIVVHGRMNDRFIPDESGPSIENGKRGFNSSHDEEIQSDLHQKGNSEGYRLSLKDKNKLEPEFNRIEEKIISNVENARKQVENAFKAKKNENEIKKLQDDALELEKDIIANPDLKNAVKNAVDRKIITEAEAKVYLRYADSERYGAVKDTPFKSTWSDLMIKRRLRQAAEEGKDSYSWTPGQAQIDRYPGLQEHYDRIEYNPETKRFKAYNKEGNLAVEKELDKSELVSHIGKETADKLINNPTRKIDYKIKQLSNGQYEVKDVNGKNRHFIDKHDAIDWVDKQGTNILDNADLKVGGEFHKKFYDEIMVNKVNAIAKKYGARVEERKLNPYDKNEYDNVIEDMKKRLKKDFYDSAVKEGFTEEKAVKFADKHTDHLEPWQLAKALGEESKLSEAFQKKLNFDKNGNMPIWFLKLTPELKKAALEKGFSMFETGLPLTPVDHDPFSQQKKKHRLIPVSHNPFSPRNM